MFYSNNLKLQNTNPAYSNTEGLQVSQKILHWATSDYRHVSSAYDLSNCFTQVSSGTISKSLNLYSNPIGEFLIEGDTVIPKTSIEADLYFEVSFSSPNNRQFFGFGEIRIQGTPTDITGIGIERYLSDFHFSIILNNAVMLRENISSWNGNSEAIQWLLDSWSGNFVYLRVSINKLTNQASLYLVKDNTCYLLHSTKPISASPISFSPYSRPLGFVAYSDRGNFGLANANLYVSPYTYYRITSVDIMPTPVVATLINTEYPIVCIGTRSTDRQCVDILGYSAIQSVARVSQTGIINFDNHVPAVFAAMSFGGYGTNLLISGFQGAGIPIPISGATRFLDRQVMNNNTANSTYSQNIIKNVCKVSAMASAEATTGKRWFAALTYSNRTTASGQSFGSLTFAEY